MLKILRIVCVISLVGGAVFAAPAAMASDAEAIAPTDAELREQQLQARRAKMLAKWERKFKEADRDANRLLTLTEAQDARLPRSMLEKFAEIDTDHDQCLSPEELITMMDRRLSDQNAPLSQ